MVSQKMITKDQQILDTLKPLFPDGLTRHQIMTKLQINPSTFQRHLKKLRAKNQIVTLRIAHNHWIYHYKPPGVFSSNTNHRLSKYAHLKQLGTTIGQNVYQPIQKKYQYTYTTQTHICAYCHLIMKHITRTNRFAGHLAKCRQQANLAQQKEHYQQQQNQLKLKESYSYV